MEEEPCNVIWSENCNHNGGSTSCYITSIHLDLPSNLAGWKFSRMHVYVSHP